MKNISIIVPIYNSEKYISKCIDSILNQEYKDFELLLINDGSTDNTSNIINSYEDERIKIYNQENKGTGSARNLGLKYATGKYIVFIDSDDSITNDYLKIMLELLEKNEADIVSCVYKQNDNTQDYDVLDREKAFKYLISLPEKIPMSVVGKIFKKETIDNIVFDENNNYEDIEFATKSFLNCKKVVFLNKKMYISNKRSDSRSSFFENDDRIIACQKSFEIIPKEILDDYITYSLFNAISIVNMMVLNNRYNYELQEKVKKFIKENIKSVKKSQYNIIKKIQIYLFHYNLNLYKKIYCNIKNKGEISG